jgi:hypothetical protein
MRTITLDFREEAARVAIRAYITELERRRSITPEAVQEISETLGAMDAEKINEPGASFVLGEHYQL